MRNLSLATTELAELPNANVVASTVDLDEHTIYVASEGVEQEGQISIEIWKLGQNGVRVYPLSTEHTTRNFEIVV